QRNYVDGLALGAFAATLVFLIIFMLIDLRLGNDDWISFFGNILVALFSIGAALLALQGVRIQTQKADEIEQQRRERSLSAARAVLPAVLSELCSVSLNNMRLHFAE